MRICDCRIFRILPHFSHISTKHAYGILFPHKLAFSTAISVFFVLLLPISIRFCYPDHLVANRMAPSMCLDPCGKRWGSLFQAILYHISAAYSVCIRSAYLFLKPHKTDMPKWTKSCYHNCIDSPHRRSCTDRSVHRIRQAGPMRTHI